MDWNAREVVGENEWYCVSGKESGALGLGVETTRG